MADQTTHHESLATRLYRGQVSYDFIGRRRRWYIISGVLLLVSIVSIATRGLHPSIDFKGGAVFQFPRQGHSISDVTSAVKAAGVNPEVVTVTGSGSASRFRVETKTLTQTATVDKVKDVETQVEQRIGVGAKDINVSTVGSTWGSQITKKAIYGLIIFLIAVIIYLSVRFEWRMALAAIIALVHDLVITAGIYSLVGFEVSPSTVIALLTILGYSLYDTVVVFDKVRENIQGITGGSRMTLSQAANLAVNQTLVRSINTSVIALLPVAGLLFVGAGLLGAGSLKDLALALLIGLASGAYSSIFIATPLVADMKEREPQYRQLARRVAARQSSAGSAAVPARTGSGGERAAAAPTATAVLEDDEPPPPSVTRTTGPGPRPGARPTSQRRGGRPGGRGGKSRKRR